MNAPQHIIAHPTVTPNPALAAPVDLHRWPQHDGLGLRHDARVALCPSGRREPMPWRFFGNGKSHENGRFIMENPIQMDDDDDDDDDDEFTMGNHGDQCKFVIV